MKERIQNFESAKRVITDAIDSEPNFSQNLIAATEKVFRLFFVERTAEKIISLYVEKNTQKTSNLSSKFLSLLSVLVATA